MKRLEDANWSRLDLFGELFDGRRESYHAVGCRGGKPVLAILPDCVWAVTDAFGVEISGPCMSKA